MSVVVIMSGTPDTIGLRPMEFQVQPNNKGTFRYHRLQPMECQFHPNKTTTASS